MIRFSRLMMMMMAMCGAATIAGAQSNTSDEKEIAQFTLTADVLRKLEVVTQETVKNMESDPVAKKYHAMKLEIDALEKKDELSDSDSERLETLKEEYEKNPYGDDNDSDDTETLDDMAAALSKIPPVAAALRTAGISPRDYSKAFLAMFQAGAYYELVKSGTIKTLPPDANPANVTFVGEHMAEIERIGKLMESVKD